MPCSAWLASMDAETTLAPTRADKVAAIDRALVGWTPSFMDVTHTFGTGIYTRTGRVKKGEFILGAKHKAANVFTLYRGSVMVWDADNGVRLLRAPYSEITPPGRQRIGFALEDFEGANIFTTTATTVDEVEREMLFPFQIPANPGELVMQLSEKAQQLLAP